MTSPLVVLTLEQLEETVTRAVRRAIGEQGAGPSSGPITISEAARRLGKSKRHVQRCLRDGRLQEDAPIGGVRMVRWPSNARSE